MRRPVFWSSDALSDLKKLGRFIAKENLHAARKVAAAIRAAGERLGDRATGRKGRVDGTYEKSVSDLPYIIAHALRASPGLGEDVVILRVIHSARDWRPGSWPKIEG